MTHLYREFLAESEHLIFPTLALVVFFVSFLTVIFRLFRGWSRRDAYDRVASLPLEEAGKEEVRHEAR